MKKRKLRIVALMLLVALIIPCYANAGNGEATKDKMLTDEEQWELLMQQAPAMTAYEQLMEAWIDESVENGTPGMLPDAFGGSYHTDDHKLAIKVVGNDEHFIEHARGIVDDPSVLVFEETDISFSGLMSLSDQLWEEAPELLSSSGINQEKSVVCVSVKESAATKERARALLQLADMEHIEIVANEGTTQLQASYNPGNMIYTNNTSTLSSKGCEGTLGWYGTAVFKDGVQRTSFITAGHVEIGFNWNSADMYFGSDRVFSRANYVIGVGEGTYCRVICGSSVVMGKPQGSSFGDYAIMASVPSPTVTAVTPTNKLQAPTKTVTVTDYLGRASLSKIQNGTYDVNSDSHIGQIYLDSGLLPGSTVVSKGKGINGSTSAQGVIQNTYAFTTSNGLTVNGLTSISSTSSPNLPFSRSGDSGAPVYYMKNSSEAMLVGIIHGGPSLDENGAVIGLNLSYITPMSTIVHKGFIPYVG